LQQPTSVQTTDNAAHRQQLPQTKPEDGLQRLHSADDVGDQWLIAYGTYAHTETAILQPFFQDHPGEPVPEENFGTLWCKGRLTDTDTPTIQLGATPSGLTSAHHHPPIFFTGRMPFLPSNQQH